MADKMNYILFEDIANEQELYDLIKQHSIKATIAPTSRVLGVCCGIFILYNSLEDKPEIEKIIEENSAEIKGFHEIKRDINPNRVKFPQIVKSKEHT